MTRHDAYVGIIRSSAIAFVIGFGSSSFVLADEPAAPTPTAPETQKPEGNPADVQNVR
jgi:hypothetical protein